MISALLQVSQGVGDAVLVMQKEVGRIHQHRAIRRLGGNRKSPQHRFGERLRHGKLLVGVGTRRAKRHVRLDQQHLGPAALKAHNPSFRNLAAVEAQVVRARAIGQRVVVEQLLALAIRAQVRDLEVEFPAARVPVDRQQAVDVFHARGLGLDRRRSRLRPLVRLVIARLRTLWQRTEGNHQKNQKGKLAHDFFYHKG